MSKQQKTDTSPATDVTKKLRQVSQPALESNMFQLGDVSTLQRAMTNPQAISPGAISGLQRSYGNNNVQRMMTGTIQTQLSPDLAVAMEEAVTGDQPESIANGQMAQRQVDDTGGVELNDSMSGQIDQELGGGQALPNRTQTKMKQNLGINDPENIKVHTDTKSDQLNQSLGARAFTSGSDIFFRQGEYNPDSTEGQQLIYHEGWHTRQQGGTAGSNPQTKMVVNPPDDKYEEEADEVAEQATQTDRQYAASGAPPEEPAGETSLQNGDVKQTMQAAESVGQLTDGVSTSPASPHLQKEDDDEDKPSEEEIKAQEEESKKETKDKVSDKRGKAEGEGEEKGKDKQKPPEVLEKVEKQSVPEQPEQLDAGLFLPENVDSSEVAYDPDDLLEEPEMESPPILPTWDELAAGTVQMQADAVNTELKFHQHLALNDEFNPMEEGSTFEVGDESEPAGSAEEVDKGAMIGDALAEGMLEGMQEGATTFLVDQAVQAATSKIPYADGFINMAKLAHDPNKWAEENVMAIGKGAVNMIKGFSAIGDEDTAWGYMAATLEAIVGVLDFVNSIVSLINTIFTIILALAKVMMIIGNAMIAIAPTAPFCILCWMAAPGSVMVTIGTTVISFLEPINTLVGAIGNVLLLVKFGLQPLIMLFRALDILESKADPEKLKEKQAKLKGATKSFATDATQRAGVNTVSAAQKGIGKAKDMRKARKDAKTEMDSPKKPTETNAEYETRTSEARAKYEDLKSQSIVKTSLKEGAGEFKVSQFKDAKESWTKTKGGKLKGDDGEVTEYKSVFGQAKDTAKTEWQATKAARTAPPGMATTTKRKVREFQENRARKKSDEAGDDWAGKRIDADDAKANHQNKKQEADQSEQEMRASRKEAIDAARSGDMERQVEANNKYNDAKQKHREAQEARDAAKSEADAKENAAKTAEDKLDKRLDDEFDATDAKTKAKQKEDEFAEWKNKQKEVAKGVRERSKQSFKDRDEGGQRHALGPLGFSSHIVSIIKDRTGFDLYGWLNKKMFNAKDADDWMNAAQEKLDEADELEKEGKKTEADSLRKEAADDLSNVDTDSLSSEADELELRAALLKGEKEEYVDVTDPDDYSSLVESLLSQANANRAQVKRYDALWARTGYHSTNQLWAEKYNVKMFILGLEADGLPAEGDNWKRTKPDDAVFVVKDAGLKQTGSAVGARLGGMAAGGAAGGAIGAEAESDYESYDKDISLDPASTSTEVMLYKGHKYTVQANPVEMQQRTKIDEKYKGLTDASEYSGGEKTEFEPAGQKSSVSGDVTTVTVKYEDKNKDKKSANGTISTKIQRAPADEEPALDLGAAPEADPAADLTTEIAAPEAEAPEPEFEEEGVAEESGEEFTEAEEMDEEEVEEGPDEDFDEDFEMEEEEEAEEESEEDDFGILALLDAGLKVTLYEQLPPPPEGVFEQMQGAALAYSEVDDEEYELKLQSQEIGGLQAHTQGQLAEVQGMRAMGDAHQQGVEKQQADADKKIEAQNQMGQKSSAQEAGAQGTANKSGGAMDTMGGIFSKILAGFGLPIPAGGDADSGGMQSGTKAQADQTAATSEATKDSTKLSQVRTGETQAVKADAAGVQGELDAFDSEMEEHESGTKEGAGELDQAMADNQEQIGVTQEEKVRLQEVHAESLAEGEAWADEHRSIREEIFGQLEGDLEASMAGETPELGEA